MREPCGFEIFNECDGINCSRDCSARAFHLTEQMITTRRDTSVWTFAGCGLAIFILSFGILLIVEHGIANAHQVNISEEPV